MNNLAHLNIKLLAFYVVMTGLVVVLFNVVTTYGESNLKAPINISGKYLLESPNLPNCLKSEKLNLTIQQSGNYIVGELSVNPPTPEVPKSSESPKNNPSQPTSESKNPHQNIKLNGLMQSPNSSTSQSDKSSGRSPVILLVGQTKQLGNNCFLSEGSSPQEIQLQAQFQNKNPIGQVRWQSEKINFTGIPQNLPKTEK